jgi:hypothetical protein
MSPKKIEEIYKRIESKSLCKCSADYLKRHTTLCALTIEDTLVKISFDVATFPRTIVYIKREDGNTTDCQFTDLEEARILWRYLVLEGFKIC